jgi:hypothetical protein
MDGLCNLSLQQQQMGSSMRCVMASTTVSAKDLAAMVKVA